MQLESKAKIAADGMAKERARWRDEILRLREQLSSLREENSSLRFNSLYPSNYSHFYQSPSSTTEPLMKGQCSPPPDMASYPEDRLLNFILTEFAV